MPPWDPGSLKYVNAKAKAKAKIVSTRFGNFCDYSQVILDVWMPIPWDGSRLVPSVSEAYLLANQSLAVYACALPTQ